MKSASAALISFLDAARLAPDAPIAFADCFTFTLSTGTVLTYTNVDQPVIYDGSTFSASGPLVQGLKYKASGLEVDKQQITIAARPTDLINGNPCLNAIREGAFDGATVQRDRVFFSGPLGSSVVGGVTLFHGRVSTVDMVGRTSATITVASDLIVLDYDMPKNLFSATCLWVLYSTGCGVIEGTYSVSGNVGSGSTATLINTPAALANHAQGKIVFTSGDNANVTATVKSVVVGTSLTLMYPLPDPPATGDDFTVAAGCNHTRAACRSIFNNLANFRGFPFVPPPQIAY